MCFCFHFQGKDIPKEGEFRGGGYKLRENNPMIHLHSKAYNIKVPVKHFFH